MIVIESIAAYLSSGGITIAGLGILLFSGLFVFVLVGVLIAAVYGVMFGLNKSLSSLNKLPVWAGALAGIILFLVLGLVFGNRFFH